MNLFKRDQRASQKMAQWQITGSLASVPLCPQFFPWPFIYYVNIFGGLFLTHPPTQYISSTEQKHEYSSEQQQKLSFFDPTHPVLFLTYCKDGLQLQCNAVQCTVWTLESCLYFLNSHSAKNWNKNLFEKDIKAFEGFENLDYYFLIAIWNSTEIVNSVSKRKWQS